MVKIENILKALIWICLAVILFSPLYLSGYLFFPFITTKTFIFNVAVELMFLAFLILSLVNKDYRIRFNLPILLSFVYIVVVSIASVLGNDFYRSFWSNNERSEGIILLIHLFLFLTVIVSFLRKIKEWLYALDLFLAGAVAVNLVALGQYFKVGWLPLSSGGERLAGTIGNAGYMGGYLVFVIFIALLMLFKWRRDTFDKKYLMAAVLSFAVVVFSGLLLESFSFKPMRVWFVIGLIVSGLMSLAWLGRNFYGHKIYYALLIAVSLFIAVQTQTRGTWLALSFCGFIFIIYLLFFYFRGMKFKIAGTVFILLSILLPVILFSARDSEFVKNNRILTRVTSISIESATAQNRLITWGSAWQGFKEKPILGWGYENFYQAFDKYFNPKINDTVWYDRAHNIIFDRLITGGVVGLISYLFLLFLPFYYFWRYFLKTKSEENSNNNRYSKFLIPIIFTLLVIAYFIQNLFIFEALVIYIPLFLCLSFVGMFGPFYDIKILRNENFKKWLLVVSLPVLVLMAYFINIKPIYANMIFTRTISNAQLSIQDRYNLFDRVFKIDVYGLQEYRRHYYSFLENLILNRYDNNSELLVLSNKVEAELKKQIEENPHSVSNYMQLMRFNNTTFSFDISRLSDNYSLFEKALKLSPTRQHLYYEMGYTYLNIASSLAQNNKDEAEKNYNLALEKFTYALDLDRNNFESYRPVVSTYIFLGENEKIVEMIKLMDEKNVKYDKATFFTQLINTAINAKNYSIIKILANYLIEINPENPSYYAQLALAHAYLGEDQEAIKVAEKIATFGGDYEKQSASFIENIKKGQFKK